MYLAARTAFRLGVLQRPRAEDESVLALAFVGSGTELGESGGVGQQCRHTHSQECSMFDVLLNEIRTILIATTLEYSDYIVYKTGSSSSDGSS